MAMTRVVVDGNDDGGATTFRAAVDAVQAGDRIVFDPSLSNAYVNNTLSTSSAFTIDGGYGRPDNQYYVVLGGNGTFTSTGQINLLHIILGGLLTFQNNGGLAQSGNIYIGDFTDDLAATVNNGPSGIWSIGGDYTIGAGNTTSHFNNNGGTLQKTGGTGTSIVAISFQNGTGAAAEVKVASGTMQFTGASNSFTAETISGAGTFAIGGGGTTTLGPGTAITTSAFAIARAGTTVTLGETLAYAGSFSDTNATTLALGANTLTLSGPASFSAGAAGSPLVTGSGKLILSGTDTISGLALGGSTLLRDNGTVNQTGTVTLGDSTNGAAQITVAAGAKWQIAGDVGVAAGSTGASINLGGGTLVKSAGSSTRSVVAPNITNTSTTQGMIRAAVGKLELAGTLSGNLALKANAGTTLLLDKAASGGTAFSYVGAGATLQLNDASEFAGAITGFAFGENLDLRSIGFGDGTTLAYAGSGSTGTLTVGDGTHTAKLVLNGTYTPSSFHLASDGHSGSLITYG